VTATVRYDVGVMSVLSAFDLPTSFLMAGLSAGDRHTALCAAGERLWNGSRQTAVYFDTPTHSKRYALVRGSLCRVDGSTSI
jgi:hypothetical protein